MLVQLNSSKEFKFSGRVKKEKRRKKPYKFVESSEELLSHIDDRKVYLVKPICELSQDGRDTDSLSSHDSQTSYQKSSSPDSSIHVALSREPPADLENPVLSKS